MSGRPAPSFMRGPSTQIYTKYSTKITGLSLPRQPCGAPPSIPKKHNNYTIKTTHSACPDSIVRRLPYKPKPPLQITTALGAQVYLLPGRQV